jgi:hypothetical protein
MFKLINDIVKIEKAFEKAGSAVGALAVAANAALILNPEKSKSFLESLPFLPYSERKNSCSVDSTKD